MLFDPNWVSFILGSHRAIGEAILDTSPGAAIAQVLLRHCHLVIILKLPNYSLASVKGCNILQVSEVSLEVQVNSELFSVLLHIGAVCSPGMCRCMMKIVF